MAEKTTREEPVAVTDKGSGDDGRETGEHHLPKVRFVRRSLELTERQFERLNELAKETHSEPTRGAMIGTSSWRSLVRRIANGEVAVVETHFARSERLIRNAHRRRERMRRGLEVGPAGTIKVVLPRQEDKA